MLKESLPSLYCGRVFAQSISVEEAGTYKFPIFVKMINKIIYWFEQQAFGVCEWWGKKLGIQTTHIRMYFIYLSFFTFGSPIIMYFIMAFVLEHKESFKPKNYKRKSVWDL